MPMPHPVRPSTGRWLTRRLAPVALATLATLGGVTPAWSAPATAAAPRVIYPTQPLSWFPGNVQAACHAWKRAGWPTRDNWHRLGHLGRVRGGREYENRGPQTVLPERGVYHEYDVPGPGYGDGNRGTLRFVRNTLRNKHRLYYTDDHYANFREMDPTC